MPQSVTILDYVVFGIFLISIFLSIIRGFVREVLSISGWIVAFIVASAYASFFEQFLPSEVVGESLRLSIAFVITFVSVLLITALLTMLLSALIKGIGLGFLDRLFGSVFGFLRALIIVTFITLLVGLTTIPTQPVWQQAIVTRSLETVAILTLPWLPEDLSKRISYEKNQDQS